MIVTRKINLAKYGLMFESLDITTNEYVTFKECCDEYLSIMKEIHEALMVSRRTLIDELNQKQTLTPEEYTLKEKLKIADNLPPF